MICSAGGSLSLALWTRSRHSHGVEPDVQRHFRYTVSEVLQDQRDDDGPLESLLDLCELDVGHHAEEDEECLSSWARYTDDILAGLVGDISGRRLFNPERERRDTPIARLYQNSDGSRTLQFEDRDLFVEVYDVGTLDLERVRRAQFWLTEHPSSLYDHIIAQEFQEFDGSTVADTEIDLRGTGNYWFPELSDAIDLTKLHEPEVHGPYLEMLMREVPRMAREMIQIMHDDPKVCLEYCRRRSCYAFYEIKGFHKMFEWAQSMLEREENDDSEAVSEAMFEEERADVKGTGTRQSKRINEAVCRGRVKPPRGCERSHRPRDLDHPHRESRKRDRARLRDTKLAQPDRMQS